MNARIEAARETLRHARESLPSPGLAIERLANALDVLIGEVERLDTHAQAATTNAVKVNEALRGIVKLFNLVKERL